MRRPDEAEKLLLFQRCLPALMDCRIYLSTSPTLLSYDEEQAFAALTKRDVDLAYGLSQSYGKWLALLGVLCSLGWICPAA